MNLHDRLVEEIKFAKFVERNYPSEPTDYTFIVNNLKLKVHRSLLASRSPVFEKLFRTEIMDMGRTYQKFEDIHRSTFVRFLRYFYCNYVPKDTNFEELYDLAMAFRFTHLKEYCEKIIINRTLQPQNAYRVYCLGNFHRSEVLTNAARNVFSMSNNTNQFCVLLKET